MICCVHSVRVLSVSRKYHWDSVTHRLNTVLPAGTVCPTDWSHTLEHHGNGQCSKIPNASRRQNNIEFHQNTELWGFQDALRLPTLASNGNWLTNCSKLSHFLCRYFYFFTIAEWSWCWVEFSESAVILEGAWVTNHFCFTLLKLTLADKTGWKN